MLTDAARPLVRGRCGIYSDTRTLLRLLNFIETVIRVWLASFDRFFISEFYRMVVILGLYAFFFDIFVSSIFSIK